MEFAKCRQFPNATTVGKKHSLRQSSRVMYSTTDGSQNTSDTAATMKNVLERRKFCSVARRLWMSILGIVKCYGECTVR